MFSIIDNFLSRFSQDLAIDLGTANILIYVAGRGVMVREPSVVCLHKKTRRILAIGTEAKKMMGRVPATIEVIRPVSNGVIADFDTTLAMVSYFVHKINRMAGSKLRMVAPKIVVGVPTAVSAVQKKAVGDVVRALGARSVVLVEEPMAAAVGAGLEVSAPVGSMIVEIGGGTCEIAVISAGGMVACRSLPVAGDSIDRDIVSYVRLRYGLILGEKTAEEVKMLIGSAMPLATEKEMVVRGRDLEKGLPKSIRLTSTQVREAIAPSIGEIVQAIADVAAQAPPELVSDIAERGITLSGGGSQIWGLPKLISQETKMPVVVAAEPFSCVVGGCAKILGMPKLAKQVAVHES